VTWATAPPPDDEAPPDDGPNDRPFRFADNEQPATSRGITHPIRTSLIEGRQVAAWRRAITRQG